MSSENIYAEKVYNKSKDGKKDFYVYIYWDGGEPFYIGKGRGHRFSAHIKEASESNIKSEKLNKIRKIIKEGRYPKITIPMKDLTEFDALRDEASLIAHYGMSKDGGVLSNKRAGWNGGYQGTKKTYDSTVYKFYNIDGRTFEGTRSDLMKTYENIGAASLSSVIKGRRRHTKGWCVKKEYVDQKIVDQTIYKFVHYLGEVVYMTIYDFSKYIGVESVKKLVDGRSKSLRGWFYSNITEDKLRGFRIGDSEPFVHKFRNIKTLEEYVINRKEFCKMIGVHAKKLDHMFNHGSSYNNEWVVVERRVGYTIPQ